ncbi:sporulation protein YtxC [Pelosinus sp. sgz500959]|uniref:sporulation protein YtxC n=1 Tax=Pelosinus sp. sgz500959 TaxID=3242472 RepID=UPI00366C4D5A
MKLLSVGLKGTTQEIRERLQLDCKTLIQDGFRVAIDEINKGHYTFIGCNVIEGELSFRNYERIKNSMKNHVAKMLAEFIVVREEKKIVKKMIDQYYAYYTEEERKVIYDHTLELLSDSNGVIVDFSMATRCTQILEKIIEYLDNHHELVLEGFINFRLKEYREKLMQIVDKAADDYMMDLEYKEFIHVLRGFVDIQEPQVEEVHVIVVQEGLYKIVDDQGQSIDNQNFESFLLQRSEQINYEDLLITALITIAPYHVVVHIHHCNNSVTQSVVETIKNIFPGRVMICERCDFCY